MNKINLNIFITLFYFCFNSCGQSTERTELKTSRELYNFLGMSDSVNIQKLIIPSLNEISKTKNDITQDILFIQKIGKNQYDIDNIKIRPFRDRGCEVIISILKEPNGILNLRNCFLHVFFYPPDLTPPTRIYNYSVEQQFIKPSTDVINLPNVPGKSN